MASAAAHQFDRAQTDQIYNAVRIPVEQLPQRVAGIAKNDKLRQALAKTNVSSADAGKVFSVISRVAQVTSQEEFHEALNTGEFPPIKLSSEEMELVRGGILPALAVCYAGGLFLAWVAQNV